MIKATDDDKMKNHENAIQKLLIKVRLINQTSQMHMTLPLFFILKFLTMF